MTKKEFLKFFRNIPDDAEVVFWMNSKQVNILGAHHEDESGNYCSLKEAKRIHISGVTKDYSEYISNRSDEDMDMDNLFELLEKYKDKIFLNMPNDDESRTRLNEVKKYNNSLLLQSFGYSMKH